MSAVELLFVSKEQIESLELQPEEILETVEQGVIAHGKGEVVMPPKTHLPIDYPNSLFNILKGYVKPINVSGVKVLGDFHDNYKHQLPSELALTILHRTETGAPFAIIDATMTTWMRTGAITALGAKILARKDSKVLGHIGARGTSWYNVRFLNKIFDFEEIRVTSRRPESSERFADILSKELKKKITVTQTTRDCVRDADIIIDASRLTHHQILVEDRWVKPGCLIQAYGAILSIAPSLPFSVDKLVVDDWLQCKGSEFGQLASLIKDGKLRDEHVFGEHGEIAAGLKPGRESDVERILFWHKGYAISDIMMADLVYRKAREKGVGTPLVQYANPQDI
ncbi:MAG: ornithine cyclodeaminase [Acidiferrobacteraceae bacterium]|nr:ornithine cyclodeaminase [Acidiferrobacteraceae bacterium]